MATKHFNAKAVKPGFTGYAEITDTSVPESGIESSTTFFTTSSTNLSIKPLKKVVKKIAASTNPQEKESYQKESPKEKENPQKENIKIAIAKLEVLAMLHPDTPLEKIINDVISLLKT